MDRLAQQAQLGPLHHDWRHRFEWKQLAHVSVAGVVLGLVLGVVVKLVSKESWWMVPITTVVVVILGVILVLWEQTTTSRRRLRVRIHRDGLVISDRGQLRAGRWEHLRLLREHKVKNHYRWVVVTPMGPVNVEDGVWRHGDELINHVRQEVDRRGGEISGPQR